MRNHFNFNFRIIVNKLSHVINHVIGHAKQLVANLDLIIIGSDNQKKNDLPTLSYYWENLKEEYKVNYFHFNIGIAVINWSHAIINVIGSKKLEKNTCSLILTGKAN